MAAPPQSAPGDVGLFKSTLLPSLARNTSLSAISYLLSYANDRVEIKDYFWGTNMVVGAWWTALGSSTCHYLKQHRESPDVAASVTHAWEDLSWSQKVLLFGVSLWGMRLTYRISSRGIRRYHAGKGNDDARYVAVKNTPNFWNTAFWKLYLPEVLSQTVIALPFTIPFRNAASSSLSPAQSDLARVVGVGIFGVGFMLEAIADGQLAYHTRKHEEGLVRNGVWSIVRHPKYVFLSFFLSNFMFGFCADHVQLSG